LRKRKILFRKSKPFIRPLSVDDLWVFWAAYKEGSFENAPADLEKDAFYSWVLEALKLHTSTLVVEDMNGRFKNRRGLVCFISLNVIGSRIEPTFVFFKWATKANLLRASVQFFNWIRYNKQVGVCVAKSLKAQTTLFHHVKRYGVLNFIGRIPGGDPLGRGDEYIFSVKGGYRRRAHGAVSSSSDASRTDASGGGSTLRLPTSPRAGSSSGPVGGGARPGV